MEKLRKIYIYDMLKYSIKKYMTIIICLILSCCLVFMYCNKNRFSDCTKGKFRVVTDRCKCSK